MIPPISGMQAIAAATFEGRPVDVDFGPVSGSGPALGGGGGGLGSSSGMTYIHKMAVVLSSKLRCDPFFVCRHLAAVFRRSTSEKTLRVTKQQLDFLNGR